MRLLCKAGFHKWMLDSAMFSMSDKCSYCLTDKDAAEAAKLALERKLWEEASDQGLSYNEMIGYVVRGLGGSNVTS